MNSWTMLLDGAWATLWISGLSIALSVVAGLGVAVLRNAQIPFVSQILATYISVTRATPMITLVLFLFVTAPYLPFEVDRWVIAVTALTINTTAFNAEILRGARVALPQGQIESAKAHGFTAFKAYYRILLPQMVLRSGPLFGNQLVGCLKDTAFLSIITIYELTAAANNLQQVHFIPMQAFIIVIALYWSISLIVEKALRSMGRYAKHRGLSYE